jgi:hypothetical protein
MQPQFRHSISEYAFRIKQSVRISDGSHFPEQCSLREMPREIFQTNLGSFVSSSTRLSTHMSPVVNNDSVCRMKMPILRSTNISERNRHGLTETV